MSKNRKENFFYSTERESVQSGERKPALSKMLRAGE
jgi:hypothetical protein